MADVGPEQVPLPEGYTLVQKLGSGGFATVWLAEQGRLGRRVAVKLLGESLEGAERQRRFLAECRAIGRLSGHPAVVTVHDAGTTPEGHPYLVMEHLSGGSLHDRLTADGPLPWTEVIVIGVHVADALSAAHDAGILHRDVKPANVLVDETGAPKLGDFGIARLSGGTSTVSGSVLGTIPYTPPEVISGGRSAPSSDVWALGVTLYTLLVGSNPFQAGGDETPAAIVARVLRCEPAPLPGTVPADLASLLGEMLRSDPDRRPASAAQVAWRLQALQAAHGLEVTPARAPRPVVDPHQAEPGGSTVGFAPVAPWQPTPPAPPTPADQPPEVKASAAPEPTRSQWATAPAPPWRTDGLPPPAPPPAPPPTPTAVFGDTVAHAANPPDGGPAAAQPVPGVPSPPPPDSRSRRRRRAPLLLGAVVVAIVIVIGGVLAVRGTGDSDDQTATGSPVSTGPPGRSADEVAGLLGVVTSVPSGTDRAPDTATAVVPDVDCGGLLRCAVDTVGGDAVIAYPSGEGLEVALVAADDGSVSWRTPVATTISNVALAVAGEVVLLVTSEDDPASEDRAQTLRTYRGLDVATGAEVWARPTFFDDDVTARRAADQASAATSILSADLGATPEHPAGPGALALDNATGQIRWEQLGQVVAVDDQHVYQALDGTVVAHEIMSGAPVWTVDVAIDGVGASDERLGVVVDEVLTTVSAGAVVGLSVQEGTPQWDPVPLADAGIDVGTPTHVSRAGDRAVVLGLSGDMAVDPADGALVWRQQREPLLQGTGTTIFVGTTGHLVAGRVGARLRLIATTGEDAGQELATADLAPGPMTLSHLAFAGGVVILTEDGVVAYSTEDLTELWTEPDTAGVATVATVDGGVVTLGPDGIALLRST